ncbi:hypothetical protein ACFCZ1_11435 [Streptomyces sp. NPDC056224]|uniref:hypothetical protein n=1 Tax=Streptomyces sp. NPDC056224 TaxID=3345750 RepID=UPI0035D6539F
MTTTGCTGRRSLSAHYTGLAGGGTSTHWDEWGVTVEDPDGYRLVLCSRTGG